MKSTYKVLGSYWDGMNSINYSDILIDKNIPNNMTKNNILFTELLAIESESDFEQLMSKITSSDEVWINIDYWIDSSNPILCAFLKKRLCQMIFHLSEIYQRIYCIH